MVNVTCRHTLSRECTFGLQYALHFGTKLPDVPSNILGLPPTFGRKCGFEVPGSCGTKLLAKMPLMLGAIWEPKCLEVLGPRLPAKEPLILRAMLGPTCLEDGGQGAWNFEAQIASKSTLVFPTPCPPRGVRP